MKGKIWVNRKMIRVKRGKIKNRRIKFRLNNF